MAYLKKKKKKSETATCSTRWDRSINFLLYWAIFATVVAWFFCSSLMSLEIICKSTHAWLKTVRMNLCDISRIPLIASTLCFFKTDNKHMFDIRGLHTSKISCPNAKRLGKSFTWSKINLLFECRGHGQQRKMPNLIWQGCSICTDIRADCKSQGSLNVILL